MVSRGMIFNNENGMDMDLAGRISRAAAVFKSRITIRCGETSSNAKSVLSVLGSGLSKGDEVEIICDGIDENKAIEAVCRIL